jgi:hypothetical protein
MIETECEHAGECSACGAHIEPGLLSLSEAGVLGDLIRGVQASAKLRYYQFGGRDADRPLVVTMRAFTQDGGGFISDKEDIRGAYVWCSGFLERWLKVSDLVKALDNIYGKHGLDNPMAVIEFDKE